MSRSKWRVIPDDHWDIGMLESWLEDEAAVGWLLVSGGTRLAKFERAEPRRCRMRLEPAVPESPEARDAKDEAYRDLGWERICELGNYQVSVSFDPHAAELQTDPVAESWALEKMLKKERRGWLMTWPVLLALYAFLAWVLQQTGEPVERLLAGNSLGLLLGVAMLPLLVWDTLRSVRGIRALRRQLKAGLPRSHSGGNWRRNHALAVVNFVFFVVIEASILCYPFYQSFGSWSADLDDLPEAIPYIQGEVLDPSLRESFDEFGYCWRETSFLAPSRYEVAEEWRAVTKHARMDTDCDILRWSFLAEALYDEKTARLREFWTEDSITEPEVPGFDHVTLAEREDLTRLIARRGKIVLMVNTTNVEGLENHLTDYAGVLADFQ